MAYIPPHALMSEIKRTASQYMKEGSEERNITKCVNVKFHFFVSIMGKSFEGSHTMDCNLATN